MFGVEHTEPGLAGIDSIMQTIKEFFGHKIKRYIIGQTLTSEAEATGLGSGVADAHLATFADIVQYDAANLEETLTEDFLRPIQLWNFPKSANHYLRFKIDTQADDSDKKLQAAKSAWEMGFRLKASDVADIIGMATADDKQLFNPQVTASIDQASEASKRPLEERIEENYYKNLGVTAGQ